MRAKELVSPNAEDELRAIASRHGSLLETALRKRGLSRIAGIDEAGRGPLAGPVVACAVILPLRMHLPKLTDSKLLSVHDRQALYTLLTTSNNVAFATAEVDHEEIDRINILQASLKAMYLAAEKLSVQPNAAIVDGPFSPTAFSVPCFAVVRGDRLCRSVSAASVIAKVVRDQIMREFDAQWPQYGFAQHSGYGTDLHMKRLLEHGPCPIHRKTFAPVARLLVPAQRP